MFQLSSAATHFGSEDRNAGDRRALLDMARWLLTDWPRTFVMT
jgi:hypothetical protein